ncbi:hypothetical protein LC605_31040 [Nostoc sp. CHAB 5836]|uniref:hypothetical protein n=1 Tax=Nostoc sp. CHAB 5836 TaxID=2780404 RepID=UPI001E326623|nr:hypothetical protein [Nostoc sp. CHAB 5836]MCC5619419.1 hypothetical protein [Nostoc sp. CHAB 5836]
MKLYTRTIPQILPDWATMATQSAGLFEVEMSNPNLHQLLEIAQTLISLIATHRDYKQLLDEGYSPDLNIADAQTALTYLQWEIDRNREPSV